MTEPDKPVSFQDQLRAAADELYPAPDRAEVMARALYALQFADQWLAEQVDQATIPMRSGDGSVRKMYRMTGHTVELAVEEGVDRRVTGAIEPAAAAWVLIRAGSHRDLVRVDEDGMFTALVPAPAGTIDIVVEFDSGTTIAMKGIGD